MSIELLHGDYLEQLAERSWDTAILDLPYSKRTHDGIDTGVDNAGYDDSSFGTKIGYDHLDETGVVLACDFLCPRTSGWIVSMTSHDLIPAWEHALKRHGLYVFAPLPYVSMGKAPRVTGDGPASWSAFVVVARPRSKIWLGAWRELRRRRGLSCSLAGAYVRSPGDSIYKPDGGKARQGAKPLGVMRAIVRDYSSPRDVVCDPSTGHGTTPMAAAIEGRRGLGCEIDDETHAVATRRLGLGYTPDLFTDLPAQPGWSP